MTMFADCREKFSRDAYPYGTQFQKHEDIPKDEINPYWDGHLKGKDRAYIIHKTPRQAVEIEG